MRVLAIDPGNEESAYVLLEGSVVHKKGKILNREMLEVVAFYARGADLEADACAIEMVASFGMPVGAEIFETCVWVGRFVELWSSLRGHEPTRIVRLRVKQHLCHDSRAKDGNIRAALIDRFGPGKDKAIGKKANPGPLFGVSADVWSALAVAVTFADQNPNARQNVQDRPG